MSGSPSAKSVEMQRKKDLFLEVQDQINELDVNCSICLQPMEDRTIIPKCSHEFCFNCLIIWTAQSRRCPLCTRAIGDYVIHNIRTRFDYHKHHLTQLRISSPQPLLPSQTTAAIEGRSTVRQRRRDREREWRESNEYNELELSIAIRRWIYKHGLYAKHVASNSFTKYRPYPTPARFAASSDLISRTTSFLRRELQIWPGLDVEFLINLVISLMKSMDIRSESAVKLLAEFLDMDTHHESGNIHLHAEHFAHEVYSYVRSPYRDLFVYDSVVQYEHPPNISPPPEQSQERSRRMPRRLCHPQGRTLGSLVSEQPEISETAEFGRHQQSGGINSETPDTRSIVTPSFKSRLHHYRGHDATMVSVENIGEPSISQKGKGKERITSS